MIIKNYFIGIRRIFTHFERLLLGLFLSFLPIINFFSIGYVLQCAKDQDYHLPKWNKVGEMFTKGFIATLISLIYLLPFLLYVGSTYSSNKIVRDLIFQTVDLSIIMKEANMIIFSIALVYLVLVLYTLPYALYKYQDGFTKAMQLKKILKETFTRKYFGIWFLGLITLVIANFIFKNIPIVGVAFGAFIAGIVFYTMIGAEYNDS